LLVIPKTHIPNCAHLAKEHLPILEDMKQLVERMTKKLEVRKGKYVETGFTRPPFNSVHHLHLHVLVLPFRSSVGRLRKWALTHPYAYVSLDNVIAKIQRK